MSPGLCGEQHICASKAGRNNARTTSQQSRCAVPLVTRLFVLYWAFVFITCSNSLIQNGCHMKRRGQLCACYGAASGTSKGSVQKQYEALGAKETRKSGLNSEGGNTAPKRRKPADGPHPAFEKQSKRRKLADGAHSIVVPKGRKSQSSSCHRNFKPDCPQCVFRKRISGWLATHGSMRETTNGVPILRAWLQERPHGMGGPWGVGCAACANLQARASMSNEKAARHIRRRFATKWSRYEIRGVLQASDIKQHKDTKIHKMAESALSRPSLPLTALLQANEDDDALLAGAVPQPEDWLRCWRSAVSPVSFRKAAEHERTNFYINPSLRATRPTSSRSSARCIWMLPSSDSET